MGLMDRVGKEFLDQFSQPKLHRFSQTRQSMGFGDMAAAPLTSGAMGAGAGALFGAAGTGFGVDGLEDMGTAAGRGALQGGAMSSGFAAAMVSPIMLKRLIVAFARAAKREMPNISDNEAITIATKHPDVQKLMRSIKLDPQPGIDPNIERAMQEIFSKRKFRGDE